MFNAAIESRAANGIDETHLSAYNAAFYELGLRWHWDSDTYQALSPAGEEKDRIRVYLETEQPHLLRAYEVNFLIDAIHATKARCYDALTACGNKVASYVNWAEIQKVELGI